MRHSHNRYRAPIRGLHPTYRPTIFGPARPGNVPEHVVFLVLKVMCAFFLCLFLWMAVCISAQLITPSPLETPVSGWCVNHGMCSVLVMSHCVPTNDSKHLLSCSVVVECAHITLSHLCHFSTQTHCSLTCCYSILYLDPNWPNPHLGSGLLCVGWPRTEVIDICLCCLFGERTSHNPGLCRLGCPLPAVNAERGDHLKISPFEFRIQDTLLHLSVWSPHTVRVTDCMYCLLLHMGMM